MNYRLVVRPEVDADLREAQEWYNLRQHGLGDRFVRTARDAMAGLLHQPLLYPVRYPRKQVRWVFPKPFPYRIVYRVTEDLVTIYAVIHAARHDRRWKSRVRTNGP